MSKVELFQDQAQVQLRDHTSRTGPNYDFRFGKLLLILPFVKTIGSRLVEQLFFHSLGSTAGQGGIVSVQRLLSDMFKSS